MHFLEFSTFLDQNNYDILTNPSKDSYDTVEKFLARCKLLLNKFKKSWKLEQNEKQAVQIKLTILRYINNIIDVV
jgi:hypothetical protein